MAVLRVVQINLTCGVGSTGTICVEISRLLTERGIENTILYSIGSSDYPLSHRCMGNAEQQLQALKSRVFGNYGFQSSAATRRMCEILDTLQPDVVHLHNLHGHNCSLEILLGYLKDRNIKVFWTFHDCWAFTGYCPHFLMANCERWKSGCGHCPDRRRYSWFFDRSAQMYEKKRKLLSGLDLTIIAPSNWMRDTVKQSFLQEVPVAVIRNGIDLDQFRPVASAFRAENHIPERKRMLLGVAANWGPRKGLDVFLRLYELLDPEQYQIVLVGVDPKTERQLPEGILAVRRTRSQRELAAIYTAADLFVNPTREDTYPTVHMESVACGTPVLTFNVGGSAEMLTEKTGRFVPKNDADALCREIESIFERDVFRSADCVAAAKAFDRDETFANYAALYDSVGRIES